MFLPLIIFEFLFFLGMWLSKTAWPLWANQSNGVEVFGVSCSVMAVAGVFSIFFAHGVKRFGCKKSIRVGVLIYLMGICLRWFSGSILIGVISGISCGIGASIVLLAIKSYAQKIQSTNVVPEFIALRNVSKQIATFLASLLIGLFFVQNLIHASSLEKHFIAVFSGCLPLLLAGVSSLFIDENSMPQEKNIDQERETVLSHSFLPLLRVSNYRKLFFATFLGGLYTSLSIPFLPVLLLQKGMLEYQSALLVTLSSATALLAQPIAVLLLKSHSKRILFFLGELFFLISLGLLVLTQDLFLIISLTVIRSLSRSISLVAEEMIELECLDSRSAPVYFGVVQTLFLFGDALGSAMGAIAIKHIGISNLFWISLILVLFHSSVFLNIGGRRLVYAGRFAPA